MAEANVVFKTFQFTDGSRTWNLPRPNLAVEAAYATHCEGRDLAAIQRHRDRLTQLDYAVLMESWLAACGSANKFGWGSSAFRQSLTNRANLVKFLWVWFAEFFNVKTVPGSPELVLTEEQVKSLLDAHEQRLVDIVTEAVDDPNPLTA